VDVDAERLARAVAAAHRRRAELIPGARVLEVDGLVVLATGLPDPSVNFCTVERAPDDPDAAVGRAAMMLGEIGMPFGIELLPGRHAGLDRALRDRGARLAFRRPLLSAVVGGLPALAPPWEVEIDLARSHRELATVAAIDAEAFEVDPAVSRGLYPRAVVEARDAAVVLARLGGEPVGAAFAVRADRAVGVFGVGVRAAARRRGIGGALTCVAARSVGMPDDVAWLCPTDDAQPLYERLGFTPGDVWEVWTS
jgi:hypothetical protein